MAGTPFERDLSIGLRYQEQQIIEDVNTARGEVFAVFDPTEEELRASGVPILGRIAIFRDGQATLIRHYGEYYPPEPGFVATYEHEGPKLLSRFGRPSIYAYERGIIDRNDTINFQGSQGITRLVVDGVDENSYKRRENEPYPRRRRV